MLNSVVLMGRLVKDIELRYAQGSNTAVAVFTLAVERDYKPQGADRPESDFIKCKAFNKTAEFISKHFKKGNLIAITGSIQTGSYDKDGQRVYTTDVMVNKVSFTGEKKDGTSTAEDFKEMPEVEDEDLPF